MATTFHEGELAVQERTGEAAQAARLTGMVADRIETGARSFLAQQQIVAVASRDDSGALWASLLLGDPGLVTSATGVAAILDREKLEQREDIAWQNLRVGAPVGLVAIDLATRRRLRVNGVVRAARADAIAIDVAESCPNCPKYIQRRALRRLGAADPGAADEMGVALDDARRARIARADTMFVASRHPTRGLDASHRGGDPGFLCVVDAHTIRVPDYDGNGMYNTLGNFVSDPHAGLAIVDFEGGRVLQLTGTASLRFDQPDDPTQPTGGTGRYWDFVVTRWIESSLPRRFAWQLLGASPFNPHAAR